jgi:hypothetical protein
MQKKSGFEAKIDQNRKNKKTIFQKNLSVGGSVSVSALVSRWALLSVTDVLSITDYFLRGHIHLSQTSFST